MFAAIAAGIEGIRTPPLPENTHQVSLRHSSPAYPVISTITPPPPEPNGAAMWMRARPMGINQPAGILKACLIRRTVDSKTLRALNSDPILNSTVFVPKYRG